MSADPNDKAAHLAGYRWAKGQSGNPGGRPKGAGVTAHLRALLKQPHNGKPLGALVAERLLRDALSGKPAQLQMLLDRTEGRAPEKVQVTAQARHLVLHIPPPRVIGERRGEEF